MRAQRFVLWLRILHELLLLCRPARPKGIARPKLVEGYRQYLMEQNKEGLAIQEALTRQITAVQKDMDSIMSVIIKTSSDALVSKLNALDGQKQELTRRLHKSQADCEVEALSEEELSCSFRQAREMLRAGKLPTVKALIERYVNKVIISGKHVEVQFNLNLSSRVATYPADAFEQKKIPQHSRQKATEVFTLSHRVATCGGEGHFRYTANKLKVRDETFAVTANKVDYIEKNPDWEKVSGYIAKLA